jgi:4-amino-4-deoxy-L-arabinose transferase-like glycosyltransferase
MTKSYDWLIALIGGAVLWLPWLGAVPLFDWDEINFAEISREMVISNQYLQPTINFRPFWEKPPLFFWLQSLSFHLWGINEFAARFPNALCGLVTLLWMIRAEPLAGRTWALFYAGSLLPHFYFRSGLIDPWYNLLSFWMVWYGLKAVNSSRISEASIAGLSGGLALLTKGPAAPAIGLMALLIYVLYSGTFAFLKTRAFAVGLVAFLVTGLSWYGLYTLCYGAEVMRDFLIYQWRLFSTPDAGHKGFPGYHVAVLFFGVMPASAYFLYALKRWASREIFPHLLLVLLVVLIFSIVKTKIVHYSSFAYLPLTLLAARSLHEEESVPRWCNSIAAFQWLLLAMGLIGSAFIIVFPDHFLSYVDDPFVRAAMADTQLRLHWPLAVAAIASLAAAISFLKARNVKDVQGTLLITALSISMAIYGLVGEVEKITQAPLIHFCKESAQSQLPVYPQGFKSYAPYFYGKVQPPGWAGPLHDAAEGQPFVILYKLKRTKDFDCSDTLKSGAFIKCLVKPSISSTSQRE